MATFYYQAKDGFEGKLASGSINAPSQEEATQELLSRGLIDIEYSGVEVETAKHSKSLSDPQVAQVVESMQNVIDAGAPLASGLAALAEEIPSKSMQASLRDMARQLDAGRSLDEIANDSKTQLPRHLVGVIRAGAVSGNIAAGLDHFVEFARQKEAHRKAFKSTMLYVYCIGVFAFFLFLFLFGWTIPQYRDVYLDFGIELPVVTKSLLFIGEMTEMALEYWFVEAPLLIMLFYVVKRFGKLLIGPARWQRILYRIPLFGPMIRFQAITEFSELLALQVRSKVGLSEALAITSEGIKDENFREGAMILSERTKSGDTLEKLAANLPHFSSELVHAFSWERKDGQLEDSLHSVSELYAAQTTAAARSLQSLLEPVSVVVIGFLLLVAIMGLFMPLVRLVNNLS